MQSKCRKLVDLATTSVRVKVISVSVISPITITYSIFLRKQTNPIIKYRYFKNN